MKACTARDGQAEGSDAGLALGLAAVRQLQAQLGLVRRQQQSLQREPAARRHLRWKGKGKKKRQKGINRMK